MHNIIIHMKLRYFFVKVFMITFFAKGFCLDLSIEDAISMAEENNATIRQQATLLKQTRLTKLNNWNYLLPSASVTASASKQNIDMNEDPEQTTAQKIANMQSGKSTTTSSTSSTKDNELTWSVSARISLSLTSAVPFDMRKNILSYLSQAEVYKSALYNLDSLVATAYWKLVASKENITLLEKDLELAQKEYDNTSKSYSKGLSSKLNLLNTQYSLEALKPQIMAAKTKYDSDKAAFCVLIGIDMPADLMLTSNLKTKKIVIEDASELAKKYIGERSDVLQKDYALQIAKLTATSSALSSYTPTLSLTQSISNIATNEDDKKPTGTFTASVTLPLDPYIIGSKTNLTVRKNYDAIDTAQLAYETTLKEGTSDIITNAKDVMRLQEAIRLALLKADIAISAYKLSKDGYNAGLVTSLDLDDYRQKMISAAQDILTAKIDYLTGLYLLATSLNLDINELYTVLDAQDISAGHEDKGMLEGIYDAM